MNNDKLAEALRDSTFVAAMLDAICETDGTVDRMKARDAARRVWEALQAHAAEAAQAQAQAAEPVLWVNPDDFANPHFIGINAAKRVHQDFGKHYTMPLYTRPQPAQGAKDAARYRWLLENSHMFSSPECDGLQLPITFCSLNDFDLTQAIDDAMAKESGQ